jgi:hypothetical protein
VGLGRKPEALVALSNALTLNRAVRATNPAALDLVATARKDAQFASLQASPEFQQLAVP